MRLCNRFFLSKHGLIRGVRSPNSLRPTGLPNTEDLGNRRLRKVLSSFAAAIHFKISLYFPQVYYQLSVGKQPSPALQRVCIHVLLRVFFFFSSRETTRYSQTVRCFPRFNVSHFTATVNKVTDGPLSPNTVTGAPEWKLKCGGGFSFSGLGA